MVDLASLTDAAIVASLLSVTEVLGIVRRQNEPHRRRVAHAAAG